MSKVGNAILLLGYLQNGKKYSVEELSKKLEISKRMVRNYKEELEKVGFFIETIRGPYGGYILKKSFDIPEIKWTTEDLNLLRKIKKQIPKSLENELDIIFEKIKISTLKKITPVEEKDKSYYNLCSKALKNHNKLKIIYLSSENIEKERIIHPLDLFYYEDGWGLAAFCELKNNLRHFSFARIKSIQVLGEKFE